VLNRIYHYFLGNIQDSDFLLKQKARVLLTIIITYAMVFSLYSLNFIVVGTKDPGILIPFIFGFLVIVFLLMMLRRGHFRLFAHTSVIAALTTIWTVMIFESGPLLQRMDTPVLIFAVLMVTPLIFLRKGSGILVYYGVNIILLILFGIYFGNRYGLSAYEIQEYVLDTVTSFSFGAFFSFQIFKIYRGALKRALFQEEELQAQYEELAASSEELEAMNDELIQTQQDLLDSNISISREKEMMATTLNSIGDGVISIDEKGVILGINRAALDILDATAGQVGKKLVDLAEFAELDLDEEKDSFKSAFYEIIENGKSLVFDQNTVIVTSKKNRKHVSAIVTPLEGRGGETTGTVIAFRDITDQHKMEEELQKNSKIESLGLFAGGLAHDFNNLLTAILGNISIVRLNLDEDDTNAEFLMDAEKASLRAKDLTSQLLTFSRGGEPIKVVSSIQSIIIDAASFVLSGSSVNCTFDLPDDLWHVVIDRGQIGQVIQNFALNARQAMTDEGSVIVSAKNILIGETGGREGLEPGRYVRIAIQDTGPGIEENILDKVFDPFFSTKKEGNGLGLAVSASIIQKHGGSVTVESIIGKGSTFEFLLPATSEKPVELLSRQGHGSFKGLRVLLMDDDNVVLKVAENMLARLGCETLTAKDGEHAIGIYRSEKELQRPVDVVIMDLTVPGGMGGKETIEVLNELDPSVCAIVSSGYSNDPIMADYRGYGFKSYIVKPYKIEEIEDAIAMALIKKEN